MKKTAIVSCYFQHNYGSMLQAYATQMALDKLGYENETIDMATILNQAKETLKTCRKVKKEAENMYVFIFAKTFL